MKNKKTYIILGLLALTLSTLIGCNKTEDSSSIILTTSELILRANEAIATRDGYATDSELGLNEGQAIDRETTSDTTIDGAYGSQGSIEDINESEIVEGTALTQEELEELKANAINDQKIGFEAYEALSKGESYTDYYGCNITEVVGRPGDTSWRQMTNEEAKAALEKDPNDIVADGELSAGTWNVYYGGKIYFNPYDYVEAMRQARQEDSSHIIDSKAKPFELAEPERARELYRDSGYTEEEIDAKFAEIEAWYNQQNSR